jgi:hypothetical protein
LTVASVASNLLPATDDVYTLGNIDQRWESLYLGPGTIFIQDTANAEVTAELRVTDGVLQINGADQLQVGQLKFVMNTIQSTTANIDIQIGETSDTANLVLNRNVLVPNVGSISITGSGKIGYGTGAGGTVTQLTDKTTGVTLNTASGEITMAGNQLGGDSTVSFVLTNSVIANTDVMIVNQVGGGNVGLYSFNAVCNSGSANISVHNMTNTNRSDAIVLRYVVIKGAVA